VFYQFAVTVGAFGLTDLLVISRGHREAAQPGFAS
jgi:hypothetical protein